METPQFIKQLSSRPAETEQDRIHGSWMVIGCLMLAVCALSYFFFIGQSLRLDEAQSLWQTARTPIAIFHVVAEDVHVPLYHELLHFWSLFFGNTVTADRILSLIFYLLSIPAVYLLGVKAYNRGVGLWAALFLTLSPFMNWYGNEIRMYSLLALMVILNQYFFVQLWKDKRPDTWFWYTVTAVLGVYTHYFFFLNLATQALFYFIRRPLFPRGTFVRFLAAAGIVIVSFLPWVLFVLKVDQYGNQSPNLILPSTVDLFGTFQQFLIGFQSDTIDTVFLSLWPLALLFGFLALQRHRRMASETEYFMLAVFVPILSAFAFSYFVTPIFISRYLILSVPALYLCLISLFDSFPPRIALGTKVALSVLMVVMIGVEILSPFTPVRENYHEVSDYLTANAHAEDAVLISAPFTVYPIEYYYHGQTALSTLPNWNQYTFGPIPAFSPATLPAQIASSTEGAQEVWLVLSYDQGYQKTIFTYFQTHYQMLSSKVFSPNLTVYLFRIRYDAPVVPKPPVS